MGLVVLHSDAGGVRLLSRVCIVVFSALSVMLQHFQTHDGVELDGIKSKTIKAFIEQCLKFKSISNLDV